MTMFTAAKSSTSSRDSIGVISQFDLRRLRSMHTEFAEESNEQLIHRKINEVNQSLQLAESIKRMIQSDNLFSGDYIRRNEMLDHYMGELRSEATSISDSEFTIFLIDYSWKIWQELIRILSKPGFHLSVPDACPGENDNFMYTWSKDQHYLECEIFGGGEIEFFYKNRKTDYVWGEDTTLKDGFSSVILEKISLFVEVVS